MRPLFLLLSIACLSALFSTARATVYTSPSPAPTAKIAYNVRKSVVTLDVNVTYMTGANVDYTYVFSWNAWHFLSSSVYKPNACAERKQSDFNVANPMPWSNVWSRASTLSASAINGQYGAWPTPSAYWKRSLVPGANVHKRVMYRGEMTVAQLVSCGGSSITTVVDPDYITYTGKLYVHWVQPLLGPLLPSLPLTAKYSTKSTPFPFVISVSRHVDTGQGSGQISRVYAFTLSSEVVQVSPPAGGANSAKYALVAVLETHTPATMQSASSSTVAHWNALGFQSVLVENPTTTLSNLAINSSQIPACFAVDAQNYCLQQWTFRTAAPYQSSNAFNGTYKLNFMIRSCPTAQSATSSPAAQCSGSALTTAVGVHVAGTLTDTTQINVVAVLSTNLTYFTDSNYTTMRSNANYLPGESIHVRQMAMLGQLDPDFYQLDVVNVWLCNPIANGRAPMIGYDAVAGVRRYGCKQPEVLASVVNIPAGNIFQLVSNGVVVTQSQQLQRFKYASKRNAALPKSTFGFTFDTQYLNDRAFAGAFIHVESILSPTASPSSSLVHVRKLSTMAIADPIDDSGFYSVNAFGGFNLTSTDDQSGGGLTVAEAAATYSTVGVVGLIAIVGAGLYVVYKRRREKELEKERAAQETQKQIQEQLKRLADHLTSQKETSNTVAADDSSTKKINTEETCPAAVVPSTRIIIVPADPPTRFERRFSFSTETEEQENKDHDRDHYRRHEHDHDDHTNDRRDSSARRHDRRRSSGETPDQRNGNKKRKHKRAPTMMLENIELTETRS